MILFISAMYLLEQTYYQETILLLAYGFTLGSVIFGLLMHGKFLWRFRVPMSAFAGCLIGASIGFASTSTLPLLIIFAFAFTQIFRVFSLFRIVKNRVNPHALRNRSLRSELVFSFVLLVVLLVGQSNILNTLTSSQLLLTVASTQLIAAFIYASRFREMRNLCKLNIPKKFAADNQLPTVTVAIPARNETAELNDCLKSVLHSNYPKLEVLVLDDCSQDNTSDIIKKFAHDGARFLSGKIPPPSWLAKNYAYHQLFEESEGKLILFCGTDARFAPNSIRIAVQAMLDSGKKMLSILPLRDSRAGGYFLLQPMRYWRELAVPRIFDKTPPVLSTCWIIDKTFLKDHGGFAAHKKTIRPERVLSRYANRSGLYRFAYSNSEIGISSVKNLKAQWGTATRTRYPELKSRPENVFFYSLMYSTLILGSPLLLALAVSLGEMSLLSLALISTILLLYTHSSISKLVTGRQSMLKLLTFPISALLELVVSIYSMWAYEFSEVLWKGRNVCLPVLQTSPSLPPIELGSDLSEVRDEDRKS